MTQGSTPPDLKGGAIRKWQKKENNMSNQNRNVPITYRELLEALEELSDEQLDMSVSVVDADDEIFGIVDHITADEMDLGDVVDPEQPLLVLDRFSDQ